MQKKLLFALSLSLLVQPSYCVIFTNKNKHTTIVEYKDSAPMKSDPGTTTYLPVQRTETIPSNQTCTIPGGRCTIYLLKTRLCCLSYKKKIQDYKLQLPKLEQSMDAVAKKQIYTLSEELVEKTEIVLDENEHITETHSN